MADPNAEAQEDDEDTPRKRSKMPLILGLVLALGGGGAGFFATWSGMLLGSDSKAAASGKDKEKGKPAAMSADIAYVAMEPLVISLPAGAVSRHLKFRAHLEVPKESQAEVEKVIPRVIDVLNSYLRAVDPGDLEDPTALTRLRAQMLRRVQVVTGLEKVNDLLIMEFVLT